METLELVPARVKITAILKKAILSGEYQSGQELSLVEVSEKLGVSRTPVREAFQSLAADGLIELRMNKGAIVRNIDSKFIKDHFEMRVLLECAAAKKAALNHMDTKKLLNQCRFVQANLDEITTEEYSELNQNIHFTIWKCADNESMTRCLMGLWNGPSYSNENKRKEHYQKSTEEHITLLTAISEGDAEEAGAIMEKHILRSMNNLLASRSEFPD